MTQRRSRDIGDGKWRENWEPSFSRREANEVKKSEGVSGSKTWRGSELAGKSGLAANYGTVIVTVSLVRIEPSFPANFTNASEHNLRYSRGTSDRIHATVSL